jgi:hypothetical protein
MSEYKLQAPKFLTDGEIKRELETATGDRRAALEAERAERKTFRANWTPDISVGWRGVRRASHKPPMRPAATTRPKAE